MHLHGPWFVLGIIAIVMIASVMRTAIRARHGLPDGFGHHRRRHGRTDALDDARRVHLLTGENERLAGQVTRLEERVAVLERIATDPAVRTAREIEALRDR